MRKYLSSFFRHLLCWHYWVLVGWAREEHREQLWAKCNKCGKIKTYFVNKGKY